MCDFRWVETGASRFIRACVSDASVKVLAVQSQDIELAQPAIDAITAVQSKRERLAKRRSRNDAQSHTNDPESNAEPHCDVSKRFR